MTSVINEIHQMHIKKDIRIIAPPIKEEGLEYPYILSEPARKGLTCKAIMFYINFVRNYFLGKDKIRDDTIKISIDISTTALSFKE